MKELREIAAAWRTLEADGQEAVLATVVRTRGSTYRKAGARMLVTESEWVAGAISGGCLENDLLRKAWWRTREGRVLVTYDGASETDDAVSWGFGLGCDGSVDVLLERLRPGMALDPVRPVRMAIEARRPSVVSTVLDGALGRLVLGDDGSVQDDLPASLRTPVLEAAYAVSKGGGELATRVGEVEVVHERVTPPLALVVFGSNYDALPLVRFAVELGWETTVVERRPSASMQRRFATAHRVVSGRAPDVLETALGTEPPAVVVMTHEYTEDRALLRGLVERPTRYLGLLGPRARTARLFDEIGATAEQRARVQGPVGLDLGGRAPEDVALAIVAQIQATVHGRSAPALRERISSERA